MGRGGGEFLELTKYTCSVWPCGGALPKSLTSFGRMYVGTVLGMHGFLYIRIYRKAEISLSLRWEEEPANVLLWNSCCAYP